MSVSKSSINTVISVLRETIQSQQIENQQHEPTSTEYFALITTTLTATVESEHLVCLLQILISVLDKSSKYIVKSQFKSLSTNLMNIIKDSNNNLKILKYSLQCLGILTNIQDANDIVWSSKHGLQVINVLLSYIDDNNINLRKIINEQLINLLRNHKLNKYNHIRSYVSEFCIEVMKQSTRTEYKRSLYIILFLENSLVLLLDNHVIKIFESSLKLQSTNQPLLIASIYRMFDSFFQNTLNTINEKSLYQCINLLIQNKPDTLDMEANSYYCTSCASAWIKLYKLNNYMALNYLPQAINIVFQACDSEFTQVHCAIATSIKRILSEVINESNYKLLVSNSNEILASTLTEVVNILNHLLELRYQHTWIYVLDIFKHLFQLLKQKLCKIFLMETLDKLVNICHSIENKLIEVNQAIYLALSDTLGICLYTCNVGLFLSVARFTFSNDNFNIIDDSKLWILNILQKNLKLIPCSLDDFGNYILTPAKKCNKLMKQLSTNSLNNVLDQINRYQLYIMQLWSLFPEFCSFGVTDLATNFSKLYPIIESILTDENIVELKHPILTGLVLIAKTVNERRNEHSSSITSELEVLQSYSKQLLTLLLKMIEGTSTSDVLNQLVITCISQWIAISSIKLVTSITKKLLLLLLTNTTNNNSMDVDELTNNLSNNENSITNYMSIMLSIIPFISNSMVELLYGSIRPLLSNNTLNSHLIQKRSYQILESLLRIHPVVINKLDQLINVVTIIHESLDTSHINSRSVRFKCLHIILEMYDNKFEIINIILYDLLVYLKDSNKKTRDECINIFNKLISVLSSIEIINLLDRLIYFFTNDKSIIRSSVLVVICMLLLEKRDDTGLIQKIVELLPDIVALLSEKSSEQTRSILSLIRVCCSVLPIDVINNNLSTIIYAVTDGLVDEKSKYLSRCRAVVRKLVHRINEDDINAVMPDSDKALIVYVQRMNRRAYRRKKNRDKDRLQRMLGSDSDNDSDDSNNDSDIDDDNQQDYRLSSRPKATRSHELMSTFDVDIDDVLNDQQGPPQQILTTKEFKKSKNEFSNTKSKVSFEKLTYDENELDKDEDELYTVTFNSEGKLEVQMKENLIANLGNDSQKIPQSTNEPNKIISSDKSIGRKRVREPGEEYRSKKSGGDVWRKGMLEPHAFIPLNPKLLTNKNKHNAVGLFNSVIRRKSNLPSKNVKFIGNRNQRKAKRDHTKK